ncbi:hypothetical protein V7S43_004118 [Phytophthora oleae]|uniref:Leishmanolysin-like peptidase n=1 Tax=Phytophthora oleae TaxID=2107226 RepID=A0ABD3FW10_9STRA
MRTEDGTPRTPRNLDGNPTAYTSGTCPNGKAIEHYVEPSNSTIKFLTERNHVVAKMVTPRVRAYVQEHFNCSTLEGAEMESQDGGCIGSHWEERLFEPEYMTAVDSYRNVFSALTLAFFEDSGWYRVNASTSEVLHFGLNKGCLFATEKCVDPVTETPIAADHFCTSIDTQGCSVDARSRSTCSLSSKSQAIPAEYQYFLGSSTKGGINTFADFCPINVGYAGGDCSISSNLLKLGTTVINAYGETYCPTCKCTLTSLRSSDSTGWGINPPRQSGCYSMQCLNDTDSSTNTPITVVQLTIPRSKTKDSINVNCTKKGVKLSVPGFSGEITCPDPLVVCDYDDPSRLLLADIIKDNSASVTDGTSMPPTDSSDASTNGRNDTDTSSASASKNPQSGSGSSQTPDANASTSGERSHDSSEPHSSSASKEGSKNGTDSSSPMSSSGSMSAQNGTDSSAPVSREDSRSYGDTSSLSRADSSKSSESGVGSKTPASSDGDASDRSSTSENSSNSTDHEYDRASREGSLRWKDEVGSKSNSSSDSGTTPGSGGSLSVAPISNNVATPGWASYGILFVGGFLASTIGW